MAIELEKGIENYLMKKYLIEKIQDLRVQARDIQNYQELKKIKQNIMNYQFNLRNFDLDNSNLIKTI